MTRSVYCILQNLNKVYENSRCLKHIYDFWSCILLSEATTLDELWTVFQEDGVAGDQGDPYFPDEDNSHEDDGEEYNISDDTQVYVSDFI